MQKLALIVVLVALLAVGLSGVARAADETASNKSKITGTGKAVSVKNVGTKKKTSDHKIPTSKVSGKTEAAGSDPMPAK